MSEWVDSLHAELAQLGDGERVVVCHSLGCALGLRVAQTLTAELRVSRVLLVSPLSDHAFSAANHDEEFALERVDGQLLAAASTKPPHVVVSRNRSLHALRCQGPRISDHGRPRNLTAVVERNGRLAPRKPDHPVVR